MAPLTSCLAPSHRESMELSLPIASSEQPISKSNLDESVSKRINKTLLSFSLATPRRKRSSTTASSSMSTIGTELTEPNAPGQSMPALQDIPSLDIDYSTIDANDPQLQLPWLATFPLFGFAPRNPEDSRYRALAKLRLIAEQHGLHDLSITDYLLAGRVYIAFLDRLSKASLKNSTLRIKRRYRRMLRRRVNIGFGEQETGNKQDVGIQEEDMMRENHRENPFQLVRKRPRSSVRRAISLPPMSPQVSLSEFLDEDFGETINSFSILTEHIDDASSVNSSDEIDEADFHYFSSLPLSEQFANNDEIPISPLTPVSNGISNPMLESFDSNMKKRHPTIKSQHVQLLYQLMRHAESIYGLPLNVASAPSITLKSLSSRGIVCQRTGLTPQDILYERFTAEPFLPAFYVAVDHSIHAIVLCVRGTANLLDSLTDFAATQEPFAVRTYNAREDQPSIIHGYGHAGVLRSARNVFREARTALFEGVQQFPDYELVVTGHSLGAATASVLGLIIRDSSFGRQPTAVCFAPPPCMTHELAEETASSTISIVNGPDIVPRLSVALLLPYFATARYVADLPQAKKALVSVGLKSGVINWQEMKESNKIRLADMKKQHDNCRLYIPGKVLHMVSKEDVNRRDISWKKIFRKHQVEFVAVERDNFLDVRGREKGMYYSHATFKYKAKLALALKSMGAERLPKLSTRSVIRNLLNVSTSSDHLNLKTQDSSETLSSILEEFADDWP